MKLLHLSALLLFFLSVSAFSHEPVNSAQPKPEAKTPPSVNEKALDETAKIIADPKTRKDYISKDKKAKKADDFVGQIAGDPKTKNEIYQLAADVFKTLGKNNGLDPAAMEKILQNAMRDPAGFASQFTPEQKERLKRISEKLRQNRPVQ